MTLGEFVAVDGAEFVLQRRGVGEPVRDGIGISERIDIDGLDGRDSNMADTGNVAALAGAHVAELPQANGLGLFAGPDGGEEFLFEEEHGLRIPVAEATSPNEIDRAAKEWEFDSVTYGDLPLQGVVATL